jgi:hypothetical protein
MSGNWPPLRRVDRTTRRGEPASHSIVHLALCHFTPVVCSTQVVAARRTRQLTCSASFRGEPIAVRGRSGEPAHRFASWHALVTLQARYAA